MKKNNFKKPDKATVIGASAGVVGGVGAGVAAAALWPNSAEAEPVESDMLAEKVDPPTEHAEVVNTEVRYVNVVHHDKPVIKPEEQPVVKEYDHVYDASGNHVADMAVVNIDGEDYTFMDTNLDGMADQIFHDQNHNGSVDEGEVVPVEGYNFNMQGMEQIAQVTNNVQMDFAMNDATAEVSGADYVNDAHDFTSQDEPLDISNDNTESGAGMHTDGVDGSQDTMYAEPALDYTTMPDQDFSMADPMSTDGAMPDYMNDADVDGFA